MTKEKTDVCSTGYAEFWQGLRGVAVFKDITRMEHRNGQLECWNLNSLYGL